MKLKEAKRNSPYERNEPVDIKKKERKRKGNGPYVVLSGHDYLYMRCSPCPFRGKLYSHPPDTPTP